ncbi:glycerate kinase [Flexivirga caeni]|uniref:Glycerate kinase n=1 Tax=Flexivirga caeni TaxID=2294115 RepID=A0A3M9MFQ5_9MICO|nr:glycerate kinase [Flexivirga caeni]RNI24390.1 hypothetical protein EFY87_05385 [Flexivirga caeni]
MRVLICSDRWGSTPAADVTTALAEGWHERQPSTEVVAVPFSSGGTGFVRALAATVAGQTDRVWRLRAGSTDYLDGALLTTTGDSTALGAALGESVDGGARRIVVGVGDAAGVDGGAGLLRALGGSDDLQLAVPRAVARVRGVELVAAYKEDIGLLGLKGASASAVETLGWTSQQAQDNEHRISEFAATVRQLLPPQRDLLSGEVRRHDRGVGSGAGGGAAYAVATLGARLLPGADAFAEAVDLAGEVARADLVVAGTRVFDWRSLDADTVATVIRAAAAAARPSVILAEELEVGRRETMALGASAAYSILDPHRIGDAPPADLVAALTALARRVAGTWSAT